MSRKRVVEAGWYEYPQYYDMAFRDETRDEADFIEAACRKYCEFRVRRLLEPACGTGRLVVELASRGYRMTGFDLRSEPLRYLRRKLSRRGLQADLFQADMVDFALRSPVDAAFNTFNSFRYLLTEEAAAAHLDCVAQAVRPGGLYLLGLHLLPLDVDEESLERWSARHGGTKATYTLRVLETNRRKRRERLRLNVLVRRGDQELRLRDEFEFRMYTARQFRNLLARASHWELCDVYDFCYDIAEPLTFDDEITDTLFVLRRSG